MVILAPTSAPFFFLSGAAWPLDQMPLFLQRLAQLVPSTSGTNTCTPLADVAPGLCTLLALALAYGGLGWWRITRADRHARPRQTERTGPDAA